MFGKSSEERFWSRVDRSAGPDGCWFYNGYKKAPTTVEVNRIRDSCHRMAYRLIHGPIPVGLILRHRCAWGGCCNPAHLIPGTYQENSWDEFARHFAGIAPGVLATYEDIPDWKPKKRR